MKKITSFFDKPITKDNIIPGYPDPNKCSGLLSVIVRIAVALDLGAVVPTRDAEHINCCRQE